MYPKNNASPERIAVGQVVLIADGTVQTAGVTITVRGQGGAEATGGGTTAYGAEGTVYYTPTQAETNYTSFVVIASKASCLSCSQTVITTAVSTPGMVDIGAISGDTTAADNLELQYDGTGLSGATFPATQTQLSNIANVGSAIHKPATSYTLTTGTQTVGTSTSTEELDGSYHTHTDSAGTLELYYEFNIGSGVPTAVEWYGYLNGNGDDIGIFGYDWVDGGGTWKQIGTWLGSNASTDEAHIHDMFVDMVGSGANEGIVRVRFQATGLVSATMAIDQIFLAFSQGTEGYDNGAVWLDTTASNTNTTVGIDGVARNPVSTIGAANTLLASTNLHKIHVGPASSFTLAAAQENQIFEGHEWTVALGGQAVTASMFIDAAVSGTGTGAESEWEQCVFGVTSLPAMQAYDSSFTATTSGGFTMSAAGDYRFINCQSGVAGSGSPLFTLGTGAITAEFRRWSGGITFAGITSDDVITVGGEMGTINLGSPTGGTVEVRGTYKAITNAGSATVNVDGAILAADVASILADTNELQTDDIPGLIATAQADLDTITGSDGVSLASAQQSITFQPMTITASGGNNNLTLAGSGTADGIAFTRSGSGDALDTNIMAQLNAEIDTAISDASLATAASLATVDSNVDAILVDTSTTLQNTLTELNLGIIYSSAATGTLSTTQATSNLSGYADDQLIGRVLIVTSGNAEGEATDITDYANASGLLTFTALTTPMANTDTFKIV